MSKNVTFFYRSMQESWFFFFQGLQHCKLSQHIENRVNSFLKKKEPVANIEVTIRVLSSSEKEVEVKSHMRSK